MIEHIEESTPVTRQLVAEEKRLEIVERLFGAHFPTMNSAKQPKLAESEFIKSQPIFRRC